MQFGCFIYYSAFWLSVESSFVSLFDVVWVIISSKNNNNCGVIVISFTLRVNMVHLIWWTQTPLPSRPWHIIMYCARCVVPDGNWWPSQQSLAVPGRLMYCAWCVVPDGNWWPSQQSLADWCTVPDVLCQMETGDPANSAWQSLADWCTVPDVLCQMETGDPAMNSVHRGLLARSLQRVHAQMSSSDRHQRSGDVRALHVWCHWHFLRFCFLYVYP